MAFRINESPHWEMSDKKSMIRIRLKAKQGAQSKIKHLLSPI